MSDIITLTIDEGNGVTVVLTASDVASQGDVGDPGPAGDPTSAFLADRSAVAVYTRPATITRVVLQGGVSAFDGQGGTYFYDAGDTTSASNPPAVLVGADGARWKQAFAGSATATEVDPTTLTVKGADNLVYQDQVYWWSGAAYELVTDVVQLTDLTDAYAYANGLHFARTSTDSYVQLSYMIV